MIAAGVHVAFTDPSHPEVLWQREEGKNIFVHCLVSFIVLRLIMIIYYCFTMIFGFSKD